MLTAELDNIPTFDREYFKHSDLYGLFAWSSDTQSYLKVTSHSERFRETCSFEDENFGESVFTYTLCSRSTEGKYS